MIEVKKVEQNVVQFVPRRILILFSLKKQKLLGFQSIEMTMTSQ